MQLKIIFLVLGANRKKWITHINKIITHYYHIVFRLVKAHAKFRIKKVVDFVNVILFTPTLVKNKKNTRKDAILYTQYGAISYTMIRMGATRTLTSPSRPANFIHTHTLSHTRAHTHARTHTHPHKHHRWFPKKHRSCSESYRCIIVRSGYFRSTGMII